MTPYWVTFYSYKGGVGRTLALVNGAAILAQQGRRVLLVDFDLEAPGLDSFTELGLSLGRRGVVEYFSEFSQNSKAPLLQDYVQESEAASRKGGRLWVMASGRKDREYNRQRDALNWSDLYDIGLGRLMIAEWKAAITKTYQPDYVFVDSRTGLTDVGGICTLHLPDLVIALFALNRQNVDGVSSVISAIEHAKIQRHPQIVTVATPIPTMTVDDTAVAEALSRARAVLGRKIDLRVSYNPAAALTERIFAIEDTDLRRPFLIEYKDIVDRIKRLNTDGLDGLLEQAESSRESDNEPVALNIAELLQRDFADRVDAIVEVAEIYRRFGGRERALPFWQRAFDLDNSLQAAFEPLLNVYKAQRNYESILDLCDRFLRAPGTASPNAAVEAESSKAEALMALGRAEEALVCYKRVLEVGSSGLESKFNAAEAIRRATKEPNEVLWKSVIELYERRQRLSLPTYEANVAQAMHVAYACTGDVDLAREVLLKAKQLAGPVSGNIFSVLTYDYVSKEQFLKDNDRCLSALANGELWDGMKLPVAVKAEQGNTPA